MRNISGPAKFKYRRLLARLVSEHSGVLIGKRKQEIRVRHVLAGEWAIYRQMRLRALQTDPSAFCTKLEDEQQQSEHSWKKRTVVKAASGDEALWLSFSGGRAVGMAGICFEDDGFHLCHMWVDPDFRGQGAGSTLVFAAIAWARQNRPDTAIKLEVNPEQLAAVRLYQKCGFERTGRQEKMPHSRCQVIEEMVLRD